MVDATIGITPSTEASVGRRPGLSRRQFLGGVGAAALATGITDPFTSSSLLTKDLHAETITSGRSMSNTSQKIRDLVTKAANVYGFIDKEDIDRLSSAIIADGLDEKNTYQMFNKIMHLKTRESDAEKIDIKEIRSLLALNHPYLAFTIIGALYGVTSEKLPGVRIKSIEKVDFENALQLARKYDIGNLSGNDRVQFLEEFSALRKSSLDRRSLMNEYDHVVELTLK